VECDSAIVRLPVQSVGNDIPPVSFRSASYRVIRGTVLILFRTLCATRRLLSSGQRREAW